MAKHSAMVAVEMEILAQKFDRFGWERDRGSASHDGLIRDWIEALCDYPLDEIRAACRAHVLKEPQRMPNEGHIKAQIMEARRVIVASRPKSAEPERPIDNSPEAIARRLEVAARLGLKTFGGDA